MADILVRHSDTFAPATAGVRAHMSRFPTDPEGVVPHRPPILCIDRILEADAEHVVTERVVASGEDVDRGELWDLSIIEGLAQTAAVLDAFADREPGPGPRHGMLVVVRRCHLRRRARVGERVLYRVDLIRRIFPLALVRCEARAGADVLATAEMKFYLEER